MKQKELQEQLVKNMKNWQHVENSSVKSTSEIMEKTSNPILRVVMEVIQQDSQMHYRIQQSIIDTLEKEAVSITPEEVGELWGLIENHIEIEKKTIDLAKQALENIKETKMVTQQYLLGYLLQDEEKHNKMLEELNNIKTGLYPYG